MQKFKIKIDKEEKSLDVIVSNSIVGLYLGWKRLDTQKWEPLIRLLKTQAGYICNYTFNHPEMIEKYRIYAGKLLLVEEDNRVRQNFPHIFNNRMPLLRKDVEERCRYLKIDYPNIDKIAYAARSGGKINGDPFDICPIVEPDHENKYVFYSYLEGLDDNQPAKDSWLGITNSEDGFWIGTHDGKFSLGFKELVLGTLPEYFTSIEGVISEVKIINFTDPSKRQGYGILVKVMLKSENPYSLQIFQLDSNYAI